MKSKFTKSLLFVFLLLLIDQAIKIWVKTHMYVGEEFVILEKFRINFIENKGMALGMQFGGDYGKLALSLLRIVAIGGIIWYLRQLVKKKFPVITLISVSMILAGAIGNMVDSAFYGLIFDASTGTHIASFMPEGGGYERFLHGSVVDMLYFPIIKDGVFPTWLPYLGGVHFQFFRPIFNFADSCVTIGVLLIVIFRKKFMDKNEDTETKDSENETLDNSLEN